MKTALVILVSVCSAFAGEIKLGKPLALKEAVSIDKLVAAPEQYAGKTVQVKGTVRDVCKMMGCWMEIADPTSKKAVKIKVEDGDITFPATSVGKTAVAEGKFTKLELTKEQAIAQAKHEAEANNRKFDPASIQGPQTIYQIQGTGAVIVE